MFIKDYIKNTGNCKTIHLNIQNLIQLNKLQYLK